MTEATESKSPDRPISLRLGAGAAGFNWLPVFAAQQQGLFAAHGLNVEVKRLGTVDKATAAVRAGEVDMAITPPEGAIHDCLAGGNLRIIAGNVNRLPLSLIANPRFRRIEDLKGAKLGTSSLTEGTALYTMEVLRQHGLHSDDYEFAVVGVHPARWKALQEGTIDGAVQLIPLNFVAVDAGYSNLGEISDYIPEIAFTALIVDQTWAKVHRSEVVRFMRCLIEATHWVYDRANDAALVVLTAQITQAEGPYAMRALEYMRSKEIFPRDLSIPSAAFEKSIELMRKAGLADTAVLAEARLALDDSYRSEAAASFDASR
jgi:ABC-type nitrate/sulfonate/bicarbonate transport system substrate-binding protein